MGVAERPWQADTDDQTPCRATSAGAVLSTLLGRLLCLRLSPDDRVVAVCVRNKVLMLDLEVRFPGPRAPDVGPSHLFSAESLTGPASVRVLAQDSLGLPVGWASEF